MKFLAKIVALFFMVTLANVVFAGDPQQNGATTKTGQGGTSSCDSIADSQKAASSPQVDESVKTVPAAVIGK